MFSKAPNTIGLAINGVEHWRLNNDGTFYRLSTGGIASESVSATTVATLPAASTVPAGTRGFVTDASATTFHSTLVASGAQSPTLGPFKVPVVSDGTNWLIG